MNNDQIDLLLARLNQAEAKNRRFKRVAAVSLIAMTALILGGAIAEPKTDEIETQRLFLRDDNGIIRAAFQLAKDGSPSLCYFDEHERTLIEIGIDPVAGPRILMRGEGEDGVDPSGIELQVKRSGVSSIDVHQSGGPRVRIATSDQPEQTAELVIGSPGKPALRLATVPGRSEFTIQEGNGATTTMSASENGRAELVFRDKERKERLQLGTSADDSPFLQFRDGNGKSLFHAP